jgi:hypothetical protein
LLGEAVGVDLGADHPAPSGTAPHRRVSAHGQGAAQPDAGGEGDTTDHCEDGEVADDGSDDRGTADAGIWGSGMDTVVNDRAVAVRRASGCSRPTTLHAGPAHDCEVTEPCVVEDAEELGIGVGWRADGDGPGLACPGPTTVVMPGEEPANGNHTGHDDQTDESAEDQHADGGGQRLALVHEVLSVVPPGPARALDP